MTGKKKPWNPWNSGLIAPFEYKFERESLIAMFARLQSDDTYQHMPLSFMHVSGPIKTSLSNLATFDRFDRCGVGSLPTCRIRKRAHSREQTWLRVAVSRMSAIANQTSSGSAAICDRVGGSPVGCRPKGRRPPC